MDANRNSSLVRDSDEAGCTALICGWAIQVSTGKHVSADSARKKNGPFRCPGCGADAIHRYCSDDRKDHFAHFPARLSPIASSGESALHKECKNVLFESLQQRYPSPNIEEWNWHCDDIQIPARPAKGLNEKLCELKPDIAGRISNEGIATKEHRVAIEIQASALTIPRLLKRSLSYSKRGISILWVVPLTCPLGDMPFRPRLFERYLHSMYFGRTYYWHRDLGAMVQPVHFGLASRRIAEHEFREDGVTREVGGYWLPYKRIRTPMPASPVSIAEIFEHRERNAHRPWNERRAVPVMRILIDKLPLWWDSHEQEILNRWYPEEEPIPT